MSKAPEDPRAPGDAAKLERATQGSPVKPGGTGGMSLGARRVRESFNPSKDSTVDKIKRYSADLIDLCEELKDVGGGHSEQLRLVALAQTAYEEAAMWAVKAATTPK